VTSRRRSGGDLEPYFDDAIVFVRVARKPGSGRRCRRARAVVRLSTARAAPGFVTILRDADSWVRHGD
jgi:hypothetical protein